MEVEAERLRLESEKVALEQYLQHPVTKEVLRKVDEEIETLSSIIYNCPVTNIETFLAREQAFGSVRTLRGIRDTTRESLDEVKEQLKEILK